MTHAYDASYLDSVMDNMGDMLDYAVCDCGYGIEDFFSRFILSGVAAEIEAGNPRFLAGLSGPELARDVLRRTGGTPQDVTPAQTVEKSPEFWAGWILAWYQWRTGKRFSALAADGLSISKVISLYPTLHEADESKFADVADKLLRREAAQRNTNLKRIRKARGLSQRELAEASNESLRSVQLYEQRRNNINKAQAGTLASFAQVLGCSIEEIME